MRCKNCGCENDDNLYICQNCGSPLYDEDDFNDNDDLDATKVVPAVKPNDFDEQPSNNHTNNSDSEKEKKKKQQSIVIIVVLALILIAIIVGTIVAVAHNKDNSNSTTLLASTSETSTSSITSTTHKQSTSKPTTTAEATTTTTTQPTTTTTTTKPTTFTVTLSCNEGGEVQGDGKYTLGENATVTAIADDGYEFDGWYSNGTKVSSRVSYKFTVTSDKSLQAVFVMSQDDDISNEVEQ